MQKILRHVIAQLAAQIHLLVTLIGTREIRVDRQFLHFSVHESIHSTLWANSLFVDSF